MKSSPSTSSTRENRPRLSKLSRIYNIYKYKTKSALYIDEKNGAGAGLLPRYIIYRNRIDLHSKTLWEILTWFKWSPNHSKLWIDSWFISIKKLLVSCEKLTRSFEWL